MVTHQQLTEDAMTAGETVMQAQELTSQPDMSLALGQQLVAAVLESALAHDVKVSVAVVDRGGNVVTSARMDSAQLGAMLIAQDKAFTAVSFGHATGDWSESSRPGGADWGLAGTLGGRAVVFAGGMPVFAGKALVGAVGVSGAPSAVDEQCAQEAISACALSWLPTTA